MSFDGDDRPEEEEEDHDANFQFFLELAKPLVLELPSPEDNALAAAWITRLEKEPETEDEKRLRVDYLKLLLFVMQRGRLIGIFKNGPPEAALQPFPQGCGLAEMGNLLLEQAELQGSSDRNATGISYSVEISNDLKEFVAAQEIPDFGVQVYYAWSIEEPIYKWASFDEKKFPQYVRDKIRQLKVMNSEEKTNVQASPQGDSSQRKSCESSIYERTKTKVKSPQEIERSLERNCYVSRSIPPQGGQREDEKEWSLERRSRSNSKKGSPNGTPRIMSQDISKFYKGKEFQGSKEDNDLDASAGGARARGKDKLEECICRQHYRKQEAESSKRLQKCDNGGENGEAFVNEVACMAESGQRNADHYGENMYADPQRCGGEALNRERPICPAARLYMMNQTPLMKSRKTKCTTHGNANQQQSPTSQDPCAQQRELACGRKGNIQNLSDDSSKKCNKLSMGKTCSSPPSARPPCTCCCPREEKEAREIPCPKKKIPSEKTCPKVQKTTCPEPPPGQRRPLPPDGMNDGQSCNQMPFQMAFDNINRIEGCTCLEGTPPPRRLEGISRLGLGKTTPDTCITDIKPSQQQQPCISGRKGGERAEKRQQLPHQPPPNQPEEAMPTSCLKIRPRMGELCESNKKASSCPPPRTKPSNMNSACYPQMKSTTQDNYVPSRPIQADYGGNSCGAKIPDVDMGTCPPAPCGKRNLQDKRYEKDVKNLQYTPKQQQECNEAMASPGKRQFGNQSYGSEKQGGINESLLQELISPITPREFIDALSLSSAEEPCHIPGYRNVDGQDEVPNMRNVANNKYDDCPAEDDEDEDMGAGIVGYSSSSENGGNGGVGGAGQNFDDYEGNECQKTGTRRRLYPEIQETQSGPGGPTGHGRMTGQPCLSNLGSGPGPTPYNSPPQNYYPPQSFPASFSSGNPPCLVPYNSPNYNQLGQPYPLPFSSGNQLGQGGYNSSQGAYMQQNFSSSYSAGPGPYNRPQAAYIPMQTGQTFTMPRNPPVPPSYGPAQPNYNQQFLQPIMCSAPSQLRQPPDMRPGEVNRQGMNVDPHDFTQSFIANHPMPMTSTPCNTAPPPPPPNFYLSPITDSPEPQCMRGGDEIPCGRLQGGSEDPVRYIDSLETSRERTSVRSPKRSTLGKSCNRAADQSSDMKGLEPDSLMTNETQNASMSCQYGSCTEDGRKWTEPQISTRFRRNNLDRSTYK